MLSCMSFSADSPPPGWYADPAGSGGERYWDGGTWSQVTRPAGGMRSAQAQPQPQAAAYASQAQQYGQGAYGASMGRQPTLAGFWWRVLAAILDNLILLLPLGLVQQFVAGDAIEAATLWFMDWGNAVSVGAVPPTPPDGLLPPLYMYIFVSSLLLIAYRSVMVAMLGGTLGQLITGLRVVPDGSSPNTRPSWRTAGVRGATAVVFGQVPILNLVDPLSMLFSAKKQTLHDKIARTVVVKK